MVDVQFALNKSIDIAQFCRRDGTLDFSSPKLLSVVLGRIHITGSVLATTLATEEHKTLAQTIANISLKVQGYDQGKIEKISKVLLKAQAAGLLLLQMLPEQEPAIHKILVQRILKDCSTIQNIGEKKVLQKVHLHGPGYAANEIEKLRKELQEIQAALPPLN